MNDLIPDGWMSKSISDICNGKYGVVDGPFGSNLKTEHYRETGIPVFQSGFVTSNRFVRKNYVYVDDRKYQEQIRSSAAPSDILMAKIGMNAGACAIIPDDHSIGILAGNSLKMTVNTNVASNAFLVNHLHFMQQTGELRKLLTETAQPAISITTLKRHYVPLPPLPEQQKIAAILTSVDEVIEKTQAQIDKLKDLKTGMMQSLLTKGVGIDGKPHTEFKDSPVGRIPKGWEVSSVESILSDIIDYRGKAPPKSEFGVPLITAKNIRKGYINEEPREYIFENQYESWMVRGMPKFGDVFITTEAPLGNVARVPDYKFAIGQRVLTLRPIETVICTDFLMLIMQGETFRKELDLQSTGSTVAGIKQSTFRKILLPIPSIHEQKYIAKNIGSIISRTDACEKKLIHYNRLKKALMQDLLTGKVRVNVSSESVGH